MKAGKFITFEGLDGGGKSTQAKHLAQWLRDEHGLSVVETREPGGTPLGEKLRQLVLAGKVHDSISETLLMLTARCEHVSKVIKPALTKGEWVICDRFADSTYAYQGGGRGVDEEFIQTTSQKVQDGVFPDMTFYIKTPHADNASVPLLPRLADEETFEAESGDFYRRVASAYEKIAEREKSRVIVVPTAVKNRRLTVEEIAERIREKVKRLL